MPPPEPESVASLETLLEEGFGRKESRLIRERFLRLRDRRLVRIKRAMHREQRQFLELLPLLFHVNHPLLPGFVHTDTPAGVADYSPTHHEVLLAKRHVRSFTLERRALPRYPIRGIYLMGSLGTLGQDAASDLDVWLCYARDLSADEVGSLLAKAAQIEAWGATLGLQVFVFPMQAESFRDGETLPLSDESSGGLGRHLLLEEFYRTNILLAGLPPLWWLVPPHKEHEYTAYTRLLYHQRFVSPSAWLDFGGLDKVPAEAFYEAAHWQLHKSIASPYKALLKLLLYEAYAADFPHVHWVSRRIKEAIFAKDEPDPDTLDPYQLILERISEHMSARDDRDRLELARRAFYVKAGQALSRRVSHADWKRQRMAALVSGWGWTDADLSTMDTRYRWKLDRVQGERNALVAELSRGYGMLTDFARRHQAQGQLNAKELSLLGRQLYAALERRPGKVDRINPGISHDLGEPILWIEREIGQDGERWLLYRQAPGGVGRAPEPAKAAGSLVELLAWTHINGLADPGTPIHSQALPPEQGTRQHVRILQVLARQLPRKDLTPSALEAFRQPPKVTTSLLFIDAGYPGDVDDERHQFDHLFVTSWGEILVERHTGDTELELDILCRHLDMTPMQGGEREPVFHTFSFAPPHVRVYTAQLDRLAHAAWETIRALGVEARYVGRIDSRLYLVERSGEHFRWVVLGHAPELIETLGETTGRFRSTRVDAGALPGSPLPTLLEHNARGQVQVFYRVGTHGIDMWVLDDAGSLFEQHFPQAREANFLSHQRRFFDNLQTRRLLLAPDEHSGEDLKVRIRQILHDGTRWQLRDAELPEEAPGSYLDLVLVTGGSEQPHAGYQLVCGTREFDSLMLGDRFYSMVANHVLQKRRTGERYPIYITGIQPAGLESGDTWPVTEMLRLKRRLERRLNARIGISGPAEPDV